MKGLVGSLDCRIRANFALYQKNYPAASSRELDPEEIKLLRDGQA